MVKIKVLSSCYITWLIQKLICKVFLYWVINYNIKLTYYMLDVLEYHINNEKFRNNIIASLMNVYITIIIHYIYNSISIAGS